MFNNCFSFDYSRAASEEGLDFEPEPEDDRSPSPAKIESIPEDGEVMSEDASTSKMKISSKRQRNEPRHSSRSSSKSSRSSSPRKPKQYKDTATESSSDDDSASRSKPKKKKKNKKEKKEKEHKRKVYLKDEDDDRRSVDEKRKSKDDSFFGVTYIPPAGFCEECDVRYENGEKAQEHFKSRRHTEMVKHKYRCYFCNSYVQDTKGHLESQHRDMTFKCLLRGCAQPRFTQANKVIDHVRCNHPQDYRRTRNDDDLFRMKMVSMPKSLSSYGCRECNVVFHGDIKIAIVHLVSSQMLCNSLHILKELNCNPFICF